MIDELERKVEQTVNELVKKAELKAEDICVLGLSTSEVDGYKIGKNSNEQIGSKIIETVLDVLRPKGIYLAVQGCEHINRSLVIEKDVAEQHHFEVVNVKPSLHAGGAGAVAAYTQAKDPVVIEHVVAQAGIDIGDTSIGMHVKHVQVPVRTQVKEIGEAHVTALRSRPKKIGGERAQY